jgi:hypothetical protein
MINAELLPTSSPRFTRSNTDRAISIEDGLARVAVFSSVEDTWLIFLDFLFFSVIGKDQIQTENRRDTKTTYTDHFRHKKTGQRKASRCRKATQKTKMNRKEKMHGNHEKEILVLRFFFVVLGRSFFLVRLFSCLSSLLFPERSIPWHFFSSSFYLPSPSCSSFGLSQSRALEGAEGKGSRDTQTLR